jgi:hypothetical protein
VDLYSYCPSVPPVACYVVSFTFTHRKMPLHGFRCSARVTLTKGPHISHKACFSAKQSRLFFEYCYKIRPITMSAFGINVGILTLFTLKMVTKCLIYHRRARAEKSALSSLCVHRILASALQSSRAGFPLNCKDACFRSNLRGVFFGAEHSKPTTTKLESCMCAVVLLLTVGN